jgi:hypothetical protein
MVNSKIISNGNTSIIRAAFIYYGVIIAHFYNVSAILGSVALFPNREIPLEGPRLIGP